MAINTGKFEKALVSILDTKVDVPARYYGVIGAYLNGETKVYVDNRPNFVYVRLNNSDKEIVQAYNTIITANFGLAVVVEKRKDDDFFRIVDLQHTNYAYVTHSNFVVKHANSHRFGYSNTTKGADPLWLYKRQMIQPLGSVPSTRSPMRVQIFGDYYNWNQTSKYLPDTETIDFTSYKPTGSGNARWVTICIDGVTNSLTYVPSDEFNYNLYSTGIIQNILDPVDNYINLSAVLLTTGTTALEYDDIWDMREFLSNANRAHVEPHALDPINGRHTGTLFAWNVTVADNKGQNYFTGTLLEDVLQEIGFDIAVLYSGQGILPPNIVDGSGTAGYITEWADINTVRNSTLRKLGVGQLDLTADTDVSVDFDSGGTLDLRGNTLIIPTGTVSIVGEANGSIYITGTVKAGNRGIFEGSHGSGILCFSSTWFANSFSQNTTGSPIQAVSIPADITITDYVMTIYLNAGTHNSSNYWTVTLFDHAATSIYVFSTSTAGTNPQSFSGAGVYHNFRTVLDYDLTRTGNRFLYIQVDKVGNPPNITVTPANLWYYRTS